MSQINKIENFFKKVGEYYIDINGESKRGNFGSVYKALQPYMNDRCRVYMVKVMTFNEILQNEVDLFKQITEKLTKTKGKYLVKTHETIQTVNNCYVFMEYCEGGNLQEYMNTKDNNVISESEARLIIKQILVGYNQLLHNNIIHRNIKPENIMQCNGLFKISDYGYAKIFQEREQLINSYLGSFLYMSPQVLQNDVYTYKTDIYSIGVIYYYMLTGKYPFGTIYTDILINSKKEDIHFPEELKLQQETKDIIIQMLRHDERDRIDWDDLYIHIYFSKYNLINEGYNMYIQQQQQQTVKDTLRLSFLNSFQIFKKCFNIQYMIQSEDEENKKEDELSQTNMNMNILDDISIYNTTNNNSTMPLASPPKELERAQSNITNYQDDTYLKSFLSQNLMNHEYISKCSRHIIYKKQILVFLHVSITCLLYPNQELFDLQKNKDLTHRLMYAIIKKLLYEYDSTINKLKNPPNEMWRAFRSSPQCIQYIKFLEDILPYYTYIYDEIQKKLNSLKGINSLNSSKYKELLNLHKKQWNDYSALVKLVQDTYKEFISFIKNKISKFIQQANAVKTLILVAMACDANIHNNFKHPLGNEYFDFFLFYESFDKEDFHIYQEHALNLINNTN